MADTPTPGELQSQGRQLETLDNLARRFGQSMTEALAASAASGKQLNDVLSSIGTTLASSALKSGLGALQTALSDGVKGAIQSLTASASLLSFGGSALPFASGGVFSSGRVMPFAGGGVVSAPTYFPLGRGLGLMGERGAEAVLPLARGPDGRLGIQGTGTSGRPVAVTVNIATPDADSFRRSQTQVSAALARAVARGQRAL